MSALADASLSMLVGMTEYDLQGRLGYVVTNGGGTSLSSPLFAGIEAVLVQAHGRPIGFASPALYARHGGDNYHRIRDNPVGTADTIAFAWDHKGRIEIDTPGQWAAHDLRFGPGYNTATGLGSPTRQLIESFRAKR